MNRKSFGQRTAHQAFSQGANSPTASHRRSNSERTDVFEPVDFERGVIEANSVDDELREWKKARRNHVRLPWRQISLMASLCFGVGSLVLPDSVNHIVQWALFALGAISLVGGFLWTTDQLFNPIANPIFRAKCRRLREREKKLAVFTRCAVKVQNLNSTGGTVTVTIWSAARSSELSSRPQKRPLSIARWGFWKESSRDKLP
jgi:hypothetical protein